MTQIHRLKAWLIVRAWKALFFFFEDPFFAIALTALILWLSEGVAEQSGWVGCPAP